MRKAIIDVGTNSIRLIVADCLEQIEVCEKAIEITRIGEGMGAERLIKPQPLKRTAQAAADFAQRARSLGAEQVRMTATSAVREALNQQAVLKALEAAAQVPLEILSGVQEAALRILGRAVKHWRFWISAEAVRNWFMKLSRDCIRPACRLAQCV